MADRPPEPARVVVVMGVSGSGKTTLGRALADRLGAEFRDADDHHPPTNIAKMRAGQPLTDADRAPWLSRLRSLIERVLDDPAAPRLVITCSALKRSYRGTLVRPGEPIRLLFLDTDRETLTRRLADRADHFFDPALLDDQLATLERPAAEEAVRLDASRPIDRLVDRAVAAVATG